MQDLHHRIDVQGRLSPAVYTADQNGVGVDRQGFDSVEHVAYVGITGDTLSGSVKVDLRLQHSDDNSAWSDVTEAKDVLQSTTAPYVAITSTGIFATVDDNAEDDAVYRIGYRGPKRYSRVVADFTGTHTVGIEVALLAIKGNPLSAPVSGS